MLHRISQPVIPSDIAADVDCEEPTANTTHETETSQNSRSSTCIMHTSTFKSVVGANSEITSQSQASSTSDFGSVANPHALSFKDDTPKYNVNGKATNSATEVKHMADCDIDLLRGSEKVVTATEPSANHHGKSPTNVPVTCKICRKILPHEIAYRAHYESHMAEAKPHVCLHCSKRFAHHSYLKQHMRIHLGIKPYQCAECGASFVQLTHLKQHQRIHSGARPYTCKFLNCSKSFSQLSNLLTHARKHAEDKPWKCQGCYKCFASEQELLNHIPKHKTSKHHKTHVCPYCGMSYSMLSELQQHVLRMHSLNGNYKLGDLQVRLDNPAVFGDRPN